MHFLFLQACMPQKQSTPSPSTPPAQVQKEELIAHVQELASDAYLGRGTLEPGLDKAAEYISGKYADFGLTPIDGQDSFLVPYTLYQGGWSSEQSLSLIQSEPTKTLSADSWSPLPFSDSGSVSGELVFAGYGITLRSTVDDYKISMFKIRSFS